ncbi:MAG TPA: cysteine desulfurase family protein [Anaeromyxobacteraceae bacterium]|nr:cysteine desulfurase family protein [Anaeromyxobacteraceae bacterium]
MRKVYLDNNATTPLLPEVFEAMRPYFFERFGNPSSSHERGQQARAALEQARVQVAELIGARPGEIVFTSGGTEGDNLAIFGVAGPGDHVITSAIEHHAVLNACKRLESLGAPVTYLPVDGQGRVDPGDVRTALRPNTRLISVMMANNETGVVQAVEEIGRIAAEADVWFHTDAVQAAGKIVVNVDQIGCDLLAISGHKLNAPQGTGALFVRAGTTLRAMFQGGPQERGRRAGTENLPGVVGLGRGSALAREWLAVGKGEELGALRDRLERGITQQVERTRVNGGGAPRTPNTSNIVFECVAGGALADALDLEGICVSTGSACSSGSAQPPYVLLAMGLAPELAHASIRFSLGKQTSQDDVAFALERVPTVVTKLRAMSPLWEKGSAKAQT